MSSKQTNVALIQMRCGAEPEKNLGRAIEFVRDAARQGAEIVCLPELFRSQYFCQVEDHKNFDLSEEIPGKSTVAIGEAAQKFGLARLRVGLVQVIAVDLLKDLLRIRLALNSTD